MPDSIQSRDTPDALLKQVVTEALLEAERRSEHSPHDWTIEKKIPITVIGAMAVQIFAFGWYASTIDARVAALEKASPNVAVALDKLNTAREDQSVQLQHHTDLLSQILDLLHRQEDRMRGILPPTP